VLGYRIPQVREAQNANTDIGDHECSIRERL